MRVRRGRLVALVATLSLLTLVPWSAGERLPAEGATLDVPGLLWGPVITDTGLVWQGPAGLELSDAGGRTTLLGALAPRERAVAIAGGWLVLATPEAMLGGPVGGHLRSLPVSHLCDVGSGEAAPSGQSPKYALSGSVLYAALPPECVTGYSEGPWQLQAISLHRRKVRSLGAAPGTPLALAAGGGRIALLYGPSQSAVPLETRTASTAVLRVLDARSGRRLWQLPAAASAEAGSLQIDARGDVIGAGNVATPALLFRRPVRRYWWAGPRAHRVVALPLIEQAVLSEGRVAGLPAEPATGNAIAVVTLPSLQTRVVATFSGTVHVGEIALAGNKLAWSQRASAEVQQDAAHCGYLELTPPRLASIDLRTLGATPIAISGPPAPLPKCTHRVIMG